MTYKQTVKKLNDLRLTFRNFSTQQKTEKQGKEMFLEMLKLNNSISKMDIALFYTSKNNWEQENTFTNK